jgi:hypothetical protein
MRPLRLIGSVLTLWAVAALAFHTLGVRSWVSTPTPTQTEAWKVMWKDYSEPQILWTGTAGLTCLALAALVGRWNKRSRTGPGAPADQPCTDRDRP